MIQPQSFFPLHRYVVHVRKSQNPGKGRWQMLVSAPTFCEALNWGLLSGHACFEVADSVTGGFCRFHLPTQLRLL
jgi:hypothetical protein